MRLFAAAKICRPAAPQDVAHIVGWLIGQWRLRCQQTIERCAEAVNVAGRAKLIQLSGGLFGAHVLGRADRSTHSLWRRATAELGLRARSVGSTWPRITSPIGLASPQSTTNVSPYLPSMMLPGFRSRCSTPRLWAYSIALQTSMNRPSSLRSSKCSLPGSQLGRIGVKSLDGVLQAVAADEAHGVVWAAIGITAQSIHRHDPWMLQAAGDFRFEQEPAAAVWIVGESRLNLLESHFPADSLSSATNTSPRPPLACGRNTRNRTPDDVDSPID